MYATAVGEGDEMIWILLARLSVSAVATAATYIEARLRVG